MKFVNILFLLLLSNLVSQEDETLKKRAEIVKDRTVKEIESAKNGIDNAKNDLLKVKRARIDTSLTNVHLTSEGFVYPNKEMKKVEIAKREEIVKNASDRLARLKRGDEYWFGSLQTPLQLGDFGAIPNDGCQVIQVLDGSSFLAKLRYIKSLYGGPGGTTQFGETVVIIQGVDTKGMTDNTAKSFGDTVFEIPDTTTYDSTDGGTKTVFVLRLMDTKPLEDFLKKKTK